MNDRRNSEQFCSDMPTLGDTVCIHTDKIYDSCRDKDCIEDARVFLTACGQEIVDRAVNVKCRKSEIIWVFTEVDIRMTQFDIKTRKKVKVITERQNKRVR